MRAKKIVKVNFTKNIRDKLKKLGFITLIDNQQYIRSDLSLELPCAYNDDLSNIISIGAFSYVGDPRNGDKGDVEILSPTKIGRFCSIARGVRIGLGSHPLHLPSTSLYFYAKNFNRSWNKNYQQNNKLEEFEGMKPVVIEDDVWIGCGAKIRGGVTIKRGAVIGAGAVVTKDVEEYQVVGGVPATVIKERLNREPIVFDKKDLRGKLTQKDFVKFMSFRKKLQYWYDSFKMTKLS